MPAIKFPENNMQLDIPRIEKYYGAKFVGEFPFPFEDGYLDYPVSIFYRSKETRGKQTEYFAIVSSRATRWNDFLYGVTDGTYITEYVYNGLQLNEDVVYSRFETDRQELPGGAFIEGGFTKREWDAGTDGAELVRLQVIDGSIVILE
jgi:hypothetical protein